MTDENDNASNHPTTPDAFATFANFLALVVDPKAIEARSRELQQTLAAAAEGQAELATKSAKFEQHCASERAAIAARTEAVNKSEAELFVRTNQVAAREDAAREVENAWRYLLESEYVKSGFQSAEFTPLEKAKRWIAGLRVVSNDSDYSDSHAGAEIDTASGTDVATGRNDPAFIETLPPDVTLARAAQSPPRSVAARRALRRAAEH